MLGSRNSRIVRTLCSPLATNVLPRVLGKCTNRWLSQRKGITELERALLLHSDVRTARKLVRALADPVELVILTTQMDDEQQTEGKSRFDRA